MIWIVLGSFEILVRFVRHSLQSVQEWAQHPSAASAAPDPVQAVGNGLGVLLGFGCLMAGLWVLSGSARGTVLTSVLSILVGTLYLGVAGAVLLVLAVQDSPHALLFVAVVVGVLPFSGGFLLAGSLGLAGRSQYLAWRAANQRRQRPPGNRGSWSTPMTFGDGARHQVGGSLPERGIEQEPGEETWDASRSSGTIRPGGTAIRGTRTPDCTAPAARP
jgi:hypothetical protein